MDKQKTVLHRDDPGAEPLVGNEAAMGLDLRKARTRDTVLAARDAGVMRLSEPIRLLRG